MANPPAVLPNGTFRFDSLTSLRGVAALSTVLIHLVAVWALAFPALKQWRYLQQFATHTYLFVDFFFILSGFVMSHVYGRLFQQSLRFGDYLAFMRARFARVYPLHIALLGVYVALAAIGMKQGRDNPDGSILANILLIQAMGVFDYPTWNQPSWSISVEWWTYVLFPFGALLVQRLLRATVSPLGLALCLCAFGALSLRFGSADLTTGIAFVRCLIGFCAGACLYALFLKRLHLPHAGTLANLALLAIYAGLTLLPSPAVDLFAFAAFCVLVFAASHHSQTQGWMHHKLLIWAGDISYSIYLWHTLLLHVFAKLIMMYKGNAVWSEQQQIGYFLVALVGFELGILALGHLSYRLIELPMRNLLNPPKRRAQQAAVAA